MSEYVDALRQQLEADSDADLATLDVTTDNALAVGHDVWRLQWRGETTTAVAGDANLHTTCGALLDALAMVDFAGPDPAADRSVVNVLVDRLLPGESPTETDQALRSMRDAARGPARIWYRRELGGWVEDHAAAPTWPTGDRRVSDWVDRLMLPRLTAQPGRLVRALVDAVDDPSLHLYPSEIEKGSTERWAVRLDGLQIGVVGSTTGKLSIGKPGKRGDRPQRAAFIDVFGQPSVIVTERADPGMGMLGVVEAAARIRLLLRRFRAADVRGAPITHRHKADVPIVDEHTLEARLLKGLTRLDGVDESLVADDALVARGSQFPTLWGHSADARYLDALVRRDTTPLAVELKVATSGRGRNYRRSIIQAVLYRHFIRNAPDLDPWFDAANLDRDAVEGCIGVPIPTRWTPGFDQTLHSLRRVAARVGVQVHVLDVNRPGFSGGWVLPSAVAGGRGCDGSAPSRTRWVGRGRWRCGVDRC